MTRNEQIIALRGRKSYGLIAKELGITRATVAGVIFRHDWPKEKRISYPWSERRNLSGTGYHWGRMKMAEQNLYASRI